MKGVKLPKQQKPVDITKSGPQSFRDLQAQNSMNQGVDPAIYDALMGMAPVISQHDIRYNSPRPIQTPLYNEDTGDYFGNSAFDSDYLTDDDLYRMQGNPNELRAENQPWYSKLVNGVGKAGVLAATTALETAGLLYGIGQGVYDAANAEEGEEGRAFLHGLWDNPITNTLQKINEASEEYMPNYYTKEEQEGAFDIFSANFLGDKLIKNLGFMVGAFYGGMPAAWGIGKTGQALVKGAREAQLAERMGMARRVRDIYREGNKVAGAAQRQEYVDAVLAREGLTQAERAEKLKDGLDKINKIARNTKAATQTVGVVGSAINEGAIEAINNSKDWADLRIRQENDRYQKELNDAMLEVEAAYGGTEMEDAIKIQRRMELAQKHQDYLDEIEKGRAEVGNADLLMNLPILIASNAYELGRLYTRGFESTRRQMGSIWNGHKLSGELKKGTLATDKTKKKALLSALYKTNTEGVEEITQRMASDAAGNAVNNAIDRYINSGKSEDSKTTVDDYIAGVGKSIADNLQNPQAWEEYFIGAVSAAVGMPVFGSQTKNAYAKLGPIGLQGGIYGNYKDYTESMEKEQEIANYLNSRVKDPKFKALYDKLRKQHDLDKFLEDAIINRDKKEYKDIEFEKLFQDIDAAASAGHLAEFRELINYDGDYDDKDLDDLVKMTSKKVSAEEQKKRDLNRQQYLKDEIEQVSPKDEDKLRQLNNQIMEAAQRKSDLLLRLQGEDLTPEEQTVLDAEYAKVDKELDALKKQRDRMLARTPDEELFKQYTKELDEVTQRLDDDKYEDGKLEGPFIDANGEMNSSEQAKEKMKEILEKNKRTLNNAIDNYLKIRNDIDIETDGRLKREDLAFLTWMKAKILNYEERSAEMADELIEGLPALSVLQEKLKTIVDDYVNRVQEQYDNAVKHQKEVEENNKSTDKQKEAAENAVKEAKDRLDKAKTGARYNQYALKLLEMLMEEKPTTRRERKALDRGYGEDEQGKTYSEKYDNSTRAVNSDEAQAILAHPLNYGSLRKLIEISGLDEATKQKLLENVSDLFILANEKKEYTKKLREAIGNPELINDAYKNADDKLTQEQKDNKISELALRIGKVKNLAELDGVMRESSTNPEILNSALQKARQDGDDNFKKFLDDYQSGYDFMGDLMAQTRQLPEGPVAASIFETLDNAWEYAMQNGSNVKDTLKNFLNEAVSGFDENGNKDIAAALKKILKDLDAAQKASSTNKNAKEKKDNAKKEEKKEEKKPEEKGPSKLPSSLLKKAMEEQEKNEPDTRETLEKAIVDEIKAAMEKKRLIDRYDKLSGALKNRIELYNKDTSHEPFVVDDTYIRQLVQKINDEKENKENDITVEDSGNDFEETRSQQMVKDLQSSFKSDGQATEFMIFDGTGEFLLEYAVPYQPRDDREAAIQKILSDYLAYQFVNKNYLGYVTRGLNNTPKIHLLRSTQHGLNANPATFLAIEVTPAVRKAIGKFGFNNEKQDLTGELNTIQIGDKEYQIVGILSINSKESGISSEVAESFGMVQNVVSAELSKAIADERAKGDNAQPFVLSQYTLEINQIYTGRLEKYNDADDNGKVSLHTFLTSSQGKEGRRTSTEYDPSNPKAVSLPIAVVVNRSLSSNATAAVEDLMEGANSDWINHNNGAILLYIPKPDGRYYPVRCTRRTVKQWMNSSDIDGSGRTGRQLLEDILNPEKPDKNAHLGNIIGLLNTLFNDEASFSDKLQAKNMLAKYFMFGESNPIHIDETTNAITLNLGEKPEFDDGDPFEGNVMKFFDTLADADIKFTVPSPTLEGVSVNTNAVVSSGILEIGLRGFYNFNANFTLKPVKAVKNDEGDVVSFEELEVGSGASPEGSHFTKGPNIRGTEVNLDLGNGKETFYVDNGSVFNKDGSLADPDKAKVISFVISIGQDTPSCITDLLERMGYSGDVAEEIAKNFTKYKSTYIKNIEGEDWIAMQTKNGYTKVFKLDSDEGNAFFNPKSVGGEANGKKTDGAFQEEARRVAKKIVNKKKKEAEKGEVKRGVPSTPASLQKGTKGKKAAPEASENSSSVFSGITEDNINEHVSESTAISALSSVKNLPPAKDLVSNILALAKVGGLNMSDAEIEGRLYEILNAKDRKTKKGLIDKLNTELMCRTP